MEYDYECHELAHDTLWWMENRGIDGGLFAEIWSYPNSKVGVYPRTETLGLIREWKFHAVVIHDELVHDMWVKKPMIIPDYLEAMFGDQIVELCIKTSPNMTIQVWQGRNQKQ